MEEILLKIIAEFKESQKAAFTAMEKSKTPQGKAYNDGRLTAYLVAIDTIEQAITDLPVPRTAEANPTPAELLENWEKNRTRT